MKGTHYVSLISGREFSDEEVNVQIRERNVSLDELKANISCAFTEEVCRHRAASSFCSGGTGVFVNTNIPLPFTSPPPD